MKNETTGVTARCTAFAKKAGHMVTIARATATAAHIMRSADGKRENGYVAFDHHDCPAGMGHMAFMERY